MSLRMMAVHAHPDDESSKGAATYTYYRNRGAEVMVVSCTGGERGDILNDAIENRAQAERDLTGYRRREMAQAAEIMGIEHRWLGYVDSGMAQEDGTLPINSFAAVDLQAATEPLVRLIRQFRPHVLITYDESGGYPHPDHIRCHEISVEAYRAAADPVRYPDTGDTWQVSKLYYDRIFNAERMNSVYEVMQLKHPDSPLLEQMAQRRSWLNDLPKLATSRVAVGEFFEHRDNALRAHASQVSPDSSFFFWPNEIQREAWPYEDFQLVDSKVETVLPETDLFAGVKEQP